MAKKPQVPDPDRIYINELAQIVNRRAGTIRKWEASGMLPKALLPKGRGTRNRRYWTHAQVYGERGIIAWMKKNNMRPGNRVAEPDSESDHVQHLRRPKYLNGNQIQAAKKMADNGRTSDYIVEKIHPQTRYVRSEATEAALRRVFKQRGWKWPRQRKQRVTGKPHADDKALEKRVREQLKRARAA